MKFGNPYVPKILDHQKLPALDGLRAISIILVGISHVYFGKENMITSINPGATGVEIFFVISGFLITTLLLKERARMGSINLKMFYIRRAFRILPLVFLFLVCLVVINYIFTLRITTTSFLTTIFFLKNLPIKGSGDWYTAHFWSLSIEEQFYLIFPFLLHKLKISNYLWIIVLLIICIPTLDFVGYNKFDFINTNKLVHTIAFIIINLFGQGSVAILVGSLCSILIFNYEDVFERIARWKFMGFVFFVLAILTRNKFLNSSLSPYHLSMLFDFLIALTIICNLNPKAYFSVFLESRIMVRLGILSYSLYIWQQLFLHNQPWSNAFTNADNVWLNLMALFLVAGLSYEFFEQKFLVLKKKYVVASSKKDWDSPDMVLEPVRNMKDL